MDNSVKSVAVEKSFLEEKGKYSGLFAWLFSTDHKRIGIMYLVSMITFFLVAVGIGILMRLELISPGETLWVPKLITHFLRCMVSL